MRKYFSEGSRLLTGIVILLFAILSGCEKDFDGVIDTSTTSYQVTGVSNFGSFNYVVGDSSKTIFLVLNSSGGVNKVYCDIIASDGKKINNNPFILLDNGNPANGDNVAGDNKFSNILLLSQQNPIGIYKINFYITDINGVTKLVALQQFTYDNGQTNVAPVISNALVDPDTVIVTDTLFIITTVMAADSNGLNDIQSVFFKVFNPDSSGGSEISMFDDGNFLQNGDQVAGDGIFSRIISVHQNNQKGTYRFQFQAKDRGGLFSNTIDYLVLIQ